MNIRQAKQRLARRLGVNDTNIPSAKDVRYTDVLNEAHRSLLRMPGMESLRYAQMTFASVADQKLYGLPAQGIARINRITETTNDRKLEYRTPEWLDTVAPRTVAGTPWAWIPRGYAEVHTQPSDASSVFVKSTSTDTGTCYIEGITSGGYTQTVNVTMTGTTAVNVSAAVSDWIVITKFYLSAAAVGTVTLHEDSGSGTQLGQIAVGDVRAQFHVIQLYTTPSAVITYYADILRAIPEFTRDTDEPLIPEDFHDLLVDMGELKELRRSDDPQRFQMLQADLYGNGRDKPGAIAALKSFVMSHPDWRPNWNGNVAEISTLGAWFPADMRIG